MRCMVLAQVCNSATVIDFRFSSTDVAGFCAFFDKLVSRAFVFG
jgi:hypothetical protein